MFFLIKYLRLFVIKLIVGDVLIVSLMNYIFSKSVQVMSLPGMGKGMSLRTKSLNESCVCGKFTLFHLRLVGRTVAVASVADYGQMGPCFETS